MVRGLVPEGFLHKGFNEMIAFVNNKPLLIGLKGDLTFRLFSSKAINLIAGNEITLSSFMEANEYWQAFLGRLRPAFLEGIGHVPRGWCLAILCRPYVAWRDGDALCLSAYYCLTGLGAVNPTTDPSAVSSRCSWR